MDRMHDEDVWPCSIPKTIEDVARRHGGGLLGDMEGGCWETTLQINPPSLIGMVTVSYHTLSILEQQS